MTASPGGPLLREPSTYEVDVKLYRKQRNLGIALAPLHSFIGEAVG
jgi:hypothetical protein